MLKEALNGISMEENVPESLQGFVEQYGGQENLWDALIDYEQDRMERAIASDETIGMEEAEAAKKAALKEGKSEKEAETAAAEAAAKARAEMLERESLEAEAVAHASETFLGNEDFITRVCGESTETGRTIRDILGRYVKEIKAALKELKGKVTHAETKFLETQADKLDELQQKWTEAVLGTTEAVTPNAEKAGTEFSTRELPDGLKYAWADKDILKNKPAGISEEEFIHDYLADRYNENDLVGFSLDGDEIHAEKKGRTEKSKYGLAEEYVGSSYSKWLKDKRTNIFKAKMVAAGVLDDVAAVAKYNTTQETKHVENKDAEFGVSVYDSIFAFPKLDREGKIIGAVAYDCRMIVLNASDGKKYLYDITQIKRNTNATSSISHFEAQKASEMRSAESGLDREGVSLKTIKSSNDEKVKTYRKMSTREATAGERQAHVETAVSEMSDEDVMALTREIGESNLWNFKDMSRVLDDVAKGKPELRQKLYELIEKPFNEASGAHGRNVTRKTKEIVKKMKELGITTKRQSAMVQAAGEHQHQAHCEIEVMQDKDGYHVKSKDETGRTFKGTIDRKTLIQYFGRETAERIEEGTRGLNYMQTRSFESDIAPYTDAMLKKDCKDEAEYRAVKAGMETETGTHKEKPACAGFSYGILYRNRYNSPP